MSDFNARAGHAPRHAARGNGTGDRAPALEVAHANVTDIRRELIYDNGGWRYILVVVTDLPLDPAHPAHDSGEIDGMVQAVVAAARRAGAGFDVLTVRNG